MSAGVLHASDEVFVDDPGKKIAIADGNPRG
jgi:hypothetical protein